MPSSPRWRRAAFAWVTAVSYTHLFCIAGTRFDAHDFAPEAVDNGAAALVVERYLPQLPVPQVRVSNGRGAVSRIAAAFYGHPADHLRLAGITGTKGKTTTSYLLKSICETAGHTRCV